jgi:hypothetical protein
VRVVAVIVVEGFVHKRRVIEPHRDHIHRLDGIVIRVVVSGLVLPVFVIVCVRMKEGWCDYDGSWSLSIIRDDGSWSLWNRGGGRCDFNFHEIDGRIGANNGGPSFVVARCTATGQAVSHSA